MQHARPLDSTAVRDRQTGGPSGRRALIVLFLVTLAGTVPFLDQAFHIDDEVYVRLAGELVDSPATFLARSAPLFGRETPLVDQTQHPPLTLACLALLRWGLGHASELPFHAAYAGFTFLSVYGLFRLLRRLTPHAFPVSLLIAVSPPFVVSSHTLMTDVPFLAFFVLALDAFLDLLEAGTRTAAARAALLASLSALTQFRGLLLPVVVLGYAWARGRGSRRLTLAALFPFGALALYELAARHLWGVSPFLRSAGFLEMTGDRLLLSCVAYLAFLGGCLGFLVIAVADRVPWRRWALLAPIGTLAVLSQRRQMDTANLLLGMLYATAGLVLVYDLLRSGTTTAVALLRRQGPDPHPDPLVSLLGVAVLASLVVMGLFACVRNLLVLIPFLLVTFVHQYPELLRPRRLATAAGLCASLALACSVSDYAWAGSYRAYARQYVEKPGVYFTGEWGFRYYMERSGARYLLASQPDLPGGSLVVRPEIAAPENRLNPDLERRLRPLAVEARDGLLPLVLMSRPGRNCGWYSEGYGILPFCVGHLMQERFVRYGVTGEEGDRSRP